MARSRLAALIEGDDLPPGEILVLRPPATYDLAGLAPERVRVLTGFRPDRDAWGEAGYVLADTAGPAAVALVVVPRSRSFARTDGRPCSRLSLRAPI